MEFFMGTIMQIKSFVSYSILFSVFVIAIGVLGKGAAILMAANPRVLTRIFVQDHEQRSIRWADITRESSGKLSLSDFNEIQGFSKLDPKKQTLVQMRESNGMVVVGVRDNDEGAFQSGWILFHTGVTFSDHGDHGHWSMKKKPAVWDSRLDQNQGNPAHVYKYDGVFYLANDKLNGYTRIDPAKYASVSGRKLGKDEPFFLKGGGNHITLAVSGNRVGYSCWVDGGGPNKGKVDVTPLRMDGKGEIAYTFNLPFGVIHGATACMDKVFFAPSDGIFWVQADLNLKLKPEDVKLNHISLGKDNDKPKRTGAFAQVDHYVLCVTGKETKSNLVLLNAMDSNPQAKMIPLNGKKGCRPLTPVITKGIDSKPLAFVFHDAPKDEETASFCDIIYLDPNGDGNFSDAEVVKSIEVGKSCVEGHYGHHDITFDADNQYGFITNPGDGTIQVLSMREMKIIQEFKTTITMPTHIIACGGIQIQD
jgi:hypothetical protein